MKYYSLNNTCISRLVLGAGDYGSSVSKADAFRMMDEYVDLGGNMLDTALVYANWVADAPRSASEKCIAQWLKTRPGRREKLLLATKGAHYSFDDAQRRSRVKPECISADIEQSLHNLGVDYIDLYWLHRDDPDVPVEPLMDVLFAAADAGKIRSFGASNWSRRRLLAANAYAAKLGRQGFIGSQIAYAFIRSLTPGGAGKQADMTQLYFDELEDAEFYRQHPEIGLFAYSSQANGYITKTLERRVLSEAVKRRYDCPSNVARAQRAEQLARQLGLSPEAVALSSLFTHDYPVWAVIGPRTYEQFQSSMQAADLILSGQQADYLHSDTK